MHPVILADVDFFFQMKSLDLQKRGHPAERAREER
jgi:hypothetical protein